MRPSDFRKHVGDVVKVVWWDAFSIDPWTPLSVLDQEMQPCECMTWGYITGVVGEMVAISSTLNVNGDVCGTLVIPAGMIRQLEVIDGKAVQHEAERLAGAGGPGGPDGSGGS